MKCNHICSSPLHRLGSRLDSFFCNWERKREEQSRVEQSSVSHTSRVPETQTAHTSQPRAGSENQSSEHTWGLVALLELWDENTDMPNSWDISPYFSKDEIICNLHGNQTSQSQNLEQTPSAQSPTSHSEHGCPDTSRQFSLIQIILQVNVKAAAQSWLLEAKLGEFDRI